MVELFSSVLGITWQENIPFSAIASSSLYLQRSHASLSHIKIHCFSSKQWLLCCIFWIFRLYTQEIFSFQIKIHNARSIIIIPWCNFHVTSLDYMDFFLFLAKCMPGTFFHYPTILHLISSLFVYLSSLIMLIWSLQTVYSNLHLIIAKYAQNSILWISVCLHLVFFSQIVKSGIMLLLP